MSAKIIQFPDEDPWLQKRRNKRDHDLLLAILNIHAIAEKLVEMGISGESLDPQPIKSLGNSLGKSCGDLLNILRGLEPKGTKISKRILAEIEETLLDLAASLTC